MYAFFSKDSIYIQLYLKIYSYVQQQNVKGLYNKEHFKSILNKSVLAQGKNSKNLTKTAETIKTLNIKLSTSFP